MNENTQKQPPLSQEPELLRLKSRALGIASYLGLAPFLWYFESAYADDDFVKHHLSYSLALTFVQLCLLIAQLFAWALIYNLFAGQIIVDNQIDPSNRFSESINIVDGALIFLSLIVSIANSLSFLFVASHGGATPGSLTFSFQPYVEYRPENVPAGLAGNQLQFIYFAGCDAGRRESAWKRALGYDHAIMFDRISLVGEHLVWVWTKSPAVIYSLQ